MCIKLVTDKDCNKMHGQQHTKYVAMVRQPEYMNTGDSVAIMLSLKQLEIRVQGGGVSVTSGVPRGVWGVQTPPKFRRPSKIVPNSPQL